LIWRKENFGKRGKPFERVVKEVLSTLDPGQSFVKAMGHRADGRRELDVLIEGSVEEFGDEFWSNAKTSIRIRLDPLGSDS